VSIPVEVDYTCPKHCRSSWEHVDIVFRHSWMSTRLYSYMGPGYRCSSFAPWALFKHELSICVDESRNSEEAKVHSSSYSERLTKLIVDVLIPFHALTGSDTTSFFAGHSKKTEWKVFEQHCNLTRSGIINQWDERCSWKFRLHNVWPVWRDEVDWQCKSNSLSERCFCWSVTPNKQCAALVYWGEVTLPSDVVETSKCFKTMLAWSYWPWMEPTGWSLGARAHVTHSYSQCLFGSDILRLQNGLSVSQMQMPESKVALYMSM